MEGRTSLTSRQPASTTLRGMMCTITFCTLEVDRTGSMSRFEKNVEEFSK
jgi:hypothetical protein